MYCPNCNSENNDSAKFCKKCGTPLKKEVSHKKIINSINDEKSSKDDTTKYIIIALIIIAIALAGAFAYIGFGNHMMMGKHKFKIMHHPVPIPFSQHNQASLSNQVQHKVLLWIYLEVVFQLAAACLQKHMPASMLVHNIPVKK